MQNKISLKQSVSLPKTHFAHFRCGSTFFKSGKKLHLHQSPTIKVITYTDGIKILISRAISWRYTTCPFPIRRQRNQKPQNTRRPRNLVTVQVVYSFSPKIYKIKKKKYFTMTNCIDPNLSKYLDAVT